MYTARKLISDVTNDLRAMSLDDRYSHRFILSKLTDKAGILFKQDADQRRIFKISDSWKRIPCVPLCEEDLLQCAFEIPHCTNLMKSQFKIHETFQSSYGNTLFVLNLDGSSKFHQTTFQAYRDIRNREYQDPNIKYFILLEGYLYLPDSEIEEVQVIGLFKNPFEVTKLVEPKANCLKPLDEPFPVPDYFIDIIKQQIFQELGKAKGIIKDERGDINSNQK